MKGIVLLMVKSSRSHWRISFLVFAYAFACGRASEEGAVTVHSSLQIQCWLRNGMIDNK